MTNPPAHGNAPVKVLVVDDSAFMRFTISKHLNNTPGIVVVGVAHDGREALGLIPELSPDVITLDVEMPHLDGISTLKEIMRTNPLPVVMLSSLTSDGAIETVQALTLGAVDFIAKPIYKANMAAILDEVAAKVLRASKARVWPLSRMAKTGELKPLPSTNKTMRALQPGEKVVVIGSSTGGPRALNMLIPLLPGNLPASVVVIQHMPVGFTRSLAERLNTISHLSVKEAEPGDNLIVGRCLVAPGGFHMTLDEKTSVALNQNPPMHGVRPAVDITMLSIAERYRDRVVGVILTGMGSDGTNGAALIHGFGGWVIAEAEESCVVWGMPRSVVEAGAADEIIPLPNVADAIIRAVGK